MAKRSIAFLVLLLAGACSARKLKTQPDFDFFYFVRQWPGTFCSQHACPLLTDRDWPRFTIHGLWPNYADGTWPEFCDKTKPFDADQISDLLHELDEFWPSYMDTSTSDDFWAHEWNKHGTCALKELPSEHSFFKTVLRLNHRYDLGRALHQNGIEPTSRKDYSKRDILAAIKDTFDAEALVHCDSQGGLTEIWMCIDKDLNAIDCKQSSADASRCPRINIKPVPGSHREGQGWNKAQLGSDSTDVNVLQAAASGGKAVVSIEYGVGYKHEGDEEEEHHPRHDHEDDDEHEHEEDEHDKHKDQHGAWNMEHNNDMLVAKEQEDDAVQGVEDNIVHVSTTALITSDSQATITQDTTTATESTATTAAAASSKGNPAKSRVSSSPSRHQPHGLVRTLCIASAGALVGVIVLTMIVSSWNRRLQAMQDTAGVNEVEDVDVLEEPLLQGLQSPRSPGVSMSGAGDPEEALRQPLMQQ